MKKFASLALATTMLLSLMSCSSGTDSSTDSTTSNQGSASTSTSSSPVELTVVTSYGGDDGNRSNYEDAYKAYEAASGNVVMDASATSNEEWKAKVMADFQTGSEPDVLFYFTGSDANTLVKGGKVVSIETIRAEYPDYASNMKDDLLPASPADGVQYAIPVNGYWEGLFVNKNVLADAGVDIPGADYTWDQFMDDCQTIKDAGYTPVAASLMEVPHYWFEFAVFNHGDVENHTEIPGSATDAVADKWVDGLNDIKAMYEAGFFPKNTLTSTDAECVQMMADDQAAFLIDGSWKIGWFADNAPEISDFTVTYVPGQGDRAATDVVGGLSMGYYITEKAWNDPEKRDAAVEFVMAMTTDEVVSKFGATAVTALTNGTIAPDDLNALEIDAIAMTAGATGVAPATQDGLSAEARGDLFARIQEVVTGSITAQEALESALALN